MLFVARVLGHNLALLGCGFIGYDVVADNAAPHWALAGRLAALHRSGCRISLEQPRFVRSGSNRISMLESHPPITMGHHHHHHHHHTPCAKSVLCHVRCPVRRLAVCRATKSIHSSSSSCSRSISACTSPPVSHASAAFAHHASFVSIIVLYNTRLPHEFTVFFDVHRCSRRVPCLQTCTSATSRS